MHRTRDFSFIKLTLNEVHYILLTLFQWLFTGKSVSFLLYKYQSNNIVVERFYSRYTSVVGR